jgi:hypothetical protein
VLAAVVRSGKRLSFVIGVGTEPTALTDVDALLRKLADRIDR